jgi:hypothetical protein
VRDVNAHAAAAVTGNRRTSTVIGIATLNQACMVCCHGALDGPAVADLRDALHAARRASSTVLVDARDVARQQRRTRGPGRSQPPAGAATTERCD